MDQQTSEVVLTEGLQEQYDSLIRELREIMSVDMPMELDMIEHSLFRGHYTFVDLQLIEALDKLNHSVTVQGMEDTLLDIIKGLACVGVVDDDATIHRALGERTMKKLKAYRRLRDFTDSWRSFVREYGGSLTIGSLARWQRFETRV